MAPPSGATGTTANRAALHLLGCVLGLIGLTVVLPGPTHWAELLDTIPSGRPGPVAIGAAAEAAILVIAAAVVWALLVWVLAVWIAAFAGRLPGAPGRCGRAVVRRIAPAAAGRIIAAAVGVSLLAGTSACAVPMMSAGSDAAAAVSGSASSTPASTPAPLGGGAGVVESATNTAAPTTSVVTAALDDVISSISIDWPGAPATPDGSAPTTEAATAPTPADQSVGDSSGASSTETSPSPPGSVTSQSPQGPTAPGTAPGDPASTAPDTADPAPNPADPTDAADPTDPAPDAAPHPADPAPDPTDRAPDPAVPSGSAASSGVTVAPGDTLWSIAHHHLTADATDQDIDTAWRAWYSANAQVIGENPDLIQPGQLLLPPDPEMGR